MKAVTCECDYSVGFLCAPCALESQIVNDLQNHIVSLQEEITEYRDALNRVINSDLVTTSRFRDYSEAFSNASEVLEKWKK